MNPFVILFYQPILNLLIWLYNTIPGGDLGWAIIALTLLVKAVLWPMSAKSLKSQKALQELQPKVQALREKFANNKEQLGREMMNLYKEQKVSPFSSCLPLLIQLPFLFAIYQVLISGFTEETLTRLYPAVANPGTVNTVFLGFIHLENPNVFIALVAGILQFFQTRMMTHNRQPGIPGAADEGIASMVNKQMMYMMPVLTVIIGATLPGGLSLYWTINTLVSLIQQILVFKKHEKEKDVEVIEAK